MALICIQIRDENPMSYASTKDWGWRYYKNTQKYILTRHVFMTSLKSF